MKYFFKVLPYLKPYPGLASLAVVVTVLSGVGSLLAPWPLKLLVDNALGNQPLPRGVAHALGALATSRGALLFLAVAAGLAITLMEGTLNVFSNYVHTKLDQRIVLDFRSDLFRHSQRLSMSFHDQRRSGMLIYAVNSQGDAASGLLLMVLPLVQSVITLVGMFWISFCFDRILALLSLLVVPLLYGSVGFYAKHIQGRLRRVQLLEGESLSIVHEAFAMIRVIIAFGREEFEFRRFREQGDRAVRARVWLTVLQTCFSLAVNMTTALGTALVLGFGAYRVLQNRLTVGELLIVLAYIGSVYKPLEAISHTVGSLQEKFVALQMAFDILDRQPEIRDIRGATKIAHAEGDIEFRDVHFSYAGRAGTLTDLSFRVRAGQVVAIVGPTGAGKTTLVSLIPRFYAPSEGQVLLDGRDIRKLTLESLRRQVSIVLQEPLLFTGTIYENILYGRLDASQEEVVAAARAANAHQFIMRLPNQYGTELGERGAQLSGGERQRLCIARAFLKDAPILILDEPTSAIDSKTEAVILEALDRLMMGRTTFMIAHRLSTIHKADLILVMNHGRIVERGTHGELLRRDGLYRQLHEMQTVPHPWPQAPTVNPSALVAGETGAL